jgi:hypothetical protein
MLMGSEVSSFKAIPERTTGDCWFVRLAFDERRDVDNCTAQTLQAGLVYIIGSFNVTEAGDVVIRGCRRGFCNLMTNFESRLSGFLLPRVHERPQALCHH